MNASTPSAPASNVSPEVEPEVNRVESIDAFASFGVRAYVTTRHFGTLSNASTEPVSVIMDRWSRLRTEILAARRFATAHQVHGTTVITHIPGWTGWLRGDAADGHIAAQRGTGLAVTVADCVPVFLAHPSGAVAAVHSGWRGTAAGILGVALAQLANLGYAAHDVRVYLGPAICGKCYEVSPDVHHQLTGQTPDRPTVVDLRALLASQARAAGVRATEILVSERCTRCDNDVYYSHRAGDAGRQVGAIIADI
jgi:polyphenol oxidase